MSIQTVSSEIKLETSAIDLWLLITIASLGKQIGCLQERFKLDREKLYRINNLEADFEDALFERNEHPHSFLLLAKKIDMIKNS